MGITPQTKVHDLIEHHPYLLDFLVSYNPEYEKLRNPVVYNTVGRFATLAAAAELGNVPVETLIDAIEREVALHRIHEEPAVASVAATGSAAPVDPAVRAERQERLKAIIRRLHDGEAVDRVKADFDELIVGVDAAEIAAMEQALIAEGMPVEEVQRLCDVHVSVFRESLEAGEAEQAREVPAGHPIEVYRHENVVAGEITGALRRSLDEAERIDTEAAAGVLDALALGLERLLAGLTEHYQRKENDLFPVLESHGIEGPTKVMWGLDDQIRARVKELLAAVHESRLDDVVNSMPEVLGMVEDMIYKEEKILFPAALDALSDDEWAAMSATVAPATAGGGLLNLTTGGLTLEQLDLMLRTMPVDVTFVDENDRVRYYSEGERVFPRTPAIIGREVRNCHPPKSVAVVERIVAEFRAGTRDSAEFWIELGERFVHIRYFALRDSAGTYRGVLEVSQDVTGIRALEGQKRLLDWE